MANHMLKGNHMNEENLSKRNFLKFGGGVVVGAGIAAVSVAAAASAIGTAADEDMLLQVAQPDPYMDEAARVRQSNVASYLSKVSKEA